MPFLTFGCQNAVTTTFKASPLKKSLGGSSRKRTLSESPYCFPMNGLIRPMSGVELCAAEIPWQAMMD